MDKETWLLWLLADSQLPTGGFVASAGLEAALQSGLVREVAADEKSSLVEFIRDSAYNQARFSLPFCTQAHCLTMRMLASQESPIDELASIDKCHHSMLSSNAVALRASAAQGGGLLSLFNRGYAHSNFMADERGQTCASIAKQLQRLSRLGEVHGHWATVFGFVCAAMEIDVARMQQLFLFQFVRQIFSAAIRLNLVGPLRAQTLQCDIHPFVSDLIARYGHLQAEYNTASLDDMFGETAVYTEPMLELYQGMHDRLYSRIFNS